MAPASLFRLLFLAAIIYAIWAKSTSSKSVSLGLILSVCVLVGLDSSTISKDVLLAATIAAIMATFSYGIATNYVKGTG